MSSHRHAVMRAPRARVGFGYRPDRTPAHHVLAQTGMIAGIGGVALGSPMICESRKKPVAGIGIAILFSFTRGWAWLNMLGAFDGVLELVIPPRKMGGYAH